MKRRVRDDKCFKRRSELTISSGLTGYLSSVLEDFTTFPLLVTFLAFFSLAFLICGVLGMVKCVGGGVSVRKYSSLLKVAAVLFTGAVGLVAGTANTTNTAHLPHRHRWVLPVSLLYMFSVS